MSSNLTSSAKSLNALARSSSLKVALPRRQRQRTILVVFRQPCQDQLAVQESRAKWHASTSSRGAIAFRRKNRLCRSACCCGAQKRRNIAFACVDFARIRSGTRQCWRTVSRLGQTRQAIAASDLIEMYRGM